MRNSMYILMAAAAMFLAAAALPGGLSSARAHVIEEGFSGFDDPAGCGTCHQEIYGEWDGSMHANSSKFSDPLHSSVHDAFTAAMEAKGGKGNYHCANCHTPTADNMAALMKGEAAPDPENPTNVRGVTCSFCHMVDAVVEGEKFHSYRVTGGIKGGSDISSAPHGARKWLFEAAYEMCLGCHGKKVGGKGGVICSMEEEGITDCIPCHMPRVDGPPAAGSGKPSHAFHGIFGAHDPAMLEKGAVVSLGVDGAKLSVTLTNPNQHCFPSTNPLRVAFLRVEAFDAGGTMVFSNFDKDPSEDPGALLVKLFGAGDRVGVPSWEAESVAKDTRLKPGEKRVLEYMLPEGASSVSAKLMYRFVPPKAIDKFGIRPDGFVEKPHMVSQARLEL